jgi:hypothetical protein
LGLLKLVRPQKLLSTSPSFRVALTGRSSLTELNIEGVKSNSVNDLIPTTLVVCISFC